MDSVDRAAVTPSKSRLARTFAKVLHIRAVTGVAPVGGIHKTKSPEKVNHDSMSKVVDGIHKTKSQEKVNPDRVTKSSETFVDTNEKLRHQLAADAFLAKLFASISTMKAAYAQMQSSQSPYDADGIQSADQMVVSELKNLSELKQSYVKKQFDDVSSPEKTQLLAEIQEQKSLLKTYEIMGKKLDSQLKLRNSEIMFLKEKLEEANKENKLIEKRLNSSGLLSVPDSLRLTSLSPTHFVSALRQTVKSIRQFVRLMINEMELAGWDLDAAAKAIEPDVDFSNANHRCFAFESFVCREMFDGFNFPYFSLSNESSLERKNRQRLFFDRFNDFKSMRTREYLVKNPGSRFARFCSAKYLSLIHPKMESSLFGNIKQRKIVNSGEFPDTTFFSAFAEMAKRVWLLHCLAFSFEPVASIFQVGKRCRFSEVFMESVCEEAFLSMNNEPLVAFTVVPGFKMGKTVIQCQVYLS